MLSRCCECGRHFDWEPIDLYEPQPALCVACETAETFDWLVQHATPQSIQSRADHLIALGRRVASVNDNQNSDFPP